MVTDKLTQIIIGQPPKVRETLNHHHLLDNSVTHLILDEVSRDHLVFETVDTLTT